ncbi:MAG: VCBS repeat-containing protein [Gemmataceae bacterium]|nr:VCBS repeat-containing protein [Gemmataceae bacterium]
MSVLLGLGDGTFVTPDLVGNTGRSTPLVADLDGDGAADIAVVNQAGDILLRRGRPGSPGAFEPPVVLNPDPHRAARSLAVVRTPAGPVLAALDARRSAVSFYSHGAGGSLARTTDLLLEGTLPVAVAAGDLNGDRRDDLVVVLSGSTEALVYLQNPAGRFGPTPAYRIAVGLSPSDVALVDMDGDQRLDIVVTSQFSGDVTVVRNDSAAPFAARLKFRAGTGLYYTDDRSRAGAVRSGEGTTALAVGPFDADSFPDLVVTNSGTNTFALLRGTGTGGLLNPETGPTFATGLHPTAVVVGRFDGDPYLDLAILNEEGATLSIFRGNGAGGFTPAGTLAAGNVPTGLSAHDANGDGRLDLLVGNDFGDVLTLLGNGDGTFQPYQRASRHIALAVADLNGDGRTDFIFANEARDRVTVQYSQPGQNFAQDRNHGLLAPGAVSSADLNRDGVADLVVANSGANNVLVYLGAGNGQFGAAQAFFTGTNPAGVTIADLNGDRLPDLVVANEGSNDVTLFLGQVSPSPLALGGRGVGGEGWTLTPGPRLRAGTGPVSTTVHDVTGDAIPDILVSNSQANTVSLLPGVGNGFFNDRDAVRFATGLAPRQVLLGNFDSNPGLDLVAVNAGSNDLTFFANPTFTSSVAGRRLASGGERPLGAAVADFNFDGLSDLVVVHNGDGRMTLLLGALSGPTLAASFFHADVSHPTAVVVTGSGEDLQVYVTEEGEETAFLLTSFGIPIPTLAAPVAPVVLPNVLLLNGPGFTADLSFVLLLAASDESGDELPVAEPVLGEGEGGEPDLADGDLPPGLTTSTADPGGGDEGEPDTGVEADGTTEEAAAVIRFMLGVDDALRAISPAAPESGAAGLEVTVAELLDSIAEVFRTWQLGLEESAASLWSSAWEFLAENGTYWSDFIDEIFGTAAAPTNDAGNPWPDRLPTESLPPLPGVEDGDELSLPAVNALDVLPVAVEDLVAALVIGGLWPVAETVRNAGRSPPKKFAWERA